MNVASWDSIRGKIKARTKKWSTIYTDKIVENDIKSQKRSEKVVLEKGEVKAGTKKISSGSTSADGFNRIWYN